MLQLLSGAVPSGLPGTTGLLQILVVRLHTQCQSCRVDIDQLRLEHRQHMHIVGQSVCPQAGPMFWSWMMQGGTLEGSVLLYIVLIS